MSLNPAKMSSLKDKHDATETMAVAKSKKPAKKVAAKVVKAAKPAKKAAPKRKK